jgi:hypothetical protein
MLGSARFSQDSRLVGTTLTYDCPMQYNLQRVSWKLNCFTQLAVSSMKQGPMMQLPVISYHTPQSTEVHGQLFWAFVGFELPSSDLPIIRE